LENQRKWLAILLCALPPIVLIIFVARYYIDAPYLDQWGLVPLIDKSMRGELSFADLWVQHNVHRILFPKIIIVFLAVMTHWNIGYEVAVIFLLACGIYGLILLQVFGTFRREQLPRPLGAAVLISFFVFSLSQYQNWLWGLQIQVFLNLMAVIAGLSLLTRCLTTSRVIAAIVLGFVATHSFANGLVYWVVGPVALLILPAKPSVRRLVLTLWTICAAITIFSFYYGYAPTEDQIGTLRLHDPIDVLLYAFVFLGSPVVDFNIVGAAFAGVLGIGIFVTSLWHLTRRRHIPAEQLLPYACIGLYAIGSAALTSIGRGGMGIQQATSSRYITFSNLLWISNIVLVSLAFARQQAQASALQPRRSPIVEILLAFVLPFFLYSSFFGMQTGKRIENLKRMAQRSILETYPNVNPNVIRILYSDSPLFARQMLDKLAQHRLSLFRDDPKSP